MVTPRPAFHAYDTMLRPQDAALPEASSVAEFPFAVAAGNATAAIGRSAESTACSALTMPAPHSLPLLGQAHSLEPLASDGQTGKPVGCGNGEALDLMRAMS